MLFVWRYLVSAVLEERPDAVTAAGLFLVVNAVEGGIPVAVDGGGGVSPALVPRLVPVDPLALRVRAARRNTALLRGEHVPRGSVQNTGVVRSQEAGCEENSGKGLSKVDF